MSTADMHANNFDDKAKKEFLAFLDHELRNPMAVILSSIELLQMEGIPKEESPELIETINKQVRVITGILEELLSPTGLTQKSSLSTTKTLPPQNGVLLSVIEHTPTMLLVDDNEIAAEALKRLLESEGYTVLLANTGSEAISKAKESHPKVIILDIGLPDMDGYDVIRTLQEEKGFMPIYIALTGYGQAADKLRAQEAGFHAHLTKPVGLKEIQRVLAGLSRPVESTAV